MTDEELVALVDKVRGLDPLQRWHVLDVCRDVRTETARACAELAMGAEYGQFAAEAIRTRFHLTHSEGNRRGE